MALLRMALALGLLLGLWQPLHAQRVSPEDARRAAQTVLQGIGGRSANASELSDVTEALGFSHLYAFNGEKGYVVLAADNRVSPVLCFSEEGHIDAEHLPEGMRAFLHEYEEAVGQAEEQVLRATSETAQQWNDLIEGRTEGLQTRESVGPLLSTTWGQEDPYNLQCPMNTEAGMRCTTGSVATAMAQIMKYWEHPKQGKGSHQDLAGDNLNLYGYDALFANFGETTYDWQHMRNNYGTMTFATDEEKQAVAELMFHCGVAVNMIYDYDGSDFFTFNTEHQGSHLQSNASFYKVGEALSGNFYYKCPSYEEHLRYSEEQWAQMIKNALTASPPRPILMIMEQPYSYSPYFGYAIRSIGYVCDGYQTLLETEYIHVNWGTGGLVNSGSFNIGIFEMNSNLYDKAYFGIEPDSANIAVNVSLPSWGTVTGAGRYPKGNTITLHAVPNDGRHFHRWTRFDSYGNTIQVSTSPDLTIKVDHDETYTAEFERDQYNINAFVTPEAGGTITGTGVYNYGTECRLIATPNLGYAFVGWFEDVEGRDYCWGTELEFPFLVFHDRNINARFVATNYTVNLLPVPFVSSGTVSGSGEYPANTTVTVTATPIGNHHFSGWVENGALISNNPTYTFTIQSDRHLLAIFGTGAQSGGGNIGSVVTNADGSQGVIFHIDPSGVGWMVAMDDASEGCTWGPSTNVQLLPDRACDNVVALEDLSGFRNTGLIRTELGTDNDYAASQVDFDHGWYLPSAGQLRKLYAALPFVDSVLYDHGGTTISEETYWSSTEYSTSDAASPMFAMSNSNKTTSHRVRAIRNYISPDDNMILAMPDSPTRGTVSVYNNGVYSYGANAAVVAQPKAGYQFDHWSEEGLPVSYNHIYTFTFTHSRRLVAHFVVSGGIGTMVHNADGSEGVVFYVNPDGTEGLMVALVDASEGCQWGTATNVMTLTDKPLNGIQALEDVSGYRNTGIIRVSQGNDSTYAAGKVDFENGWYLPASGELRKLYAALPLIETTLVRAGGSTLTEGTYWSSTEYSTSDASTPSFNMGNTAKTSTCRVRAIRKFLPSGIYSLVAKSQDTLMGTASGSGAYEYNETVTMSAEAKEGYVFESWTEDGLVVSYDATYQFPFTRNRVLVANFRVTGTVGEIVHNADGSTGVVFYQNANGTEGWMVALEDASEGCAWGPTTNINALLDYPNGGLSVLEDVSGYANTDVIRRVNGTNNGYAASVVDFNNGWYLPSAGQLRKLYAALPMIEQSLLNAGGTLLTEDAYWSSTECSSSDAYSPMFATSTSNKSTSLRVRAVRTFNCANVNMIRVRSNNLAFGGVAGGGNFELGATVSVMASPSANYVFDHWEEDGCVVSYSQLYTFTFTRTRTLTAVFVKEYSVGSIVHNADGTNGIVFYTYPSGIGGLAVALEDASTGCPWGPNEDVTALENQAPASVIDLLDEMNGRNNTQIIRDWYSGNTEYAACKTDFANGWYLPSAGQLRKLYAALPLIERAIVDAGGTTLTEDAYWSSTERSASEAWNPSFAMGSSGKTNNCRVRAIRSMLTQQTIMADVNIEDGGSVSGAGVYDYGQTCTLKATANNSYAFVNWTKNGVVVSTNMEYSFTVLGNQTYTANFVANSCNITTSFEPVGGGTVAGAGVYLMGETCTLSATPNAGYTFYSWTSGNYEVSTEPTFSFEVTASGHYTAHFTLNSYMVSATANPTGGGSVTGAHAYTHGSTATLTAYPSEGYNFINWTENGEVVSTSPTYQFVVTSDRSLQANFEADAFVVSVDIIPSNSGTVEGDGAYDYGTQATLIAHSNVRYEFYGWMEDDEVVSTDSLITFGVTENRELFAVFTEVPFAIQVTANPENGGVVSGGGVYEEGDAVTLTATANAGYTFVNWTQYGMVVSTESTYTFTVTESATFVANFFQDQPTEITQTTNLTSGWNWWSTYVEADDLYDQLKTGLGANATQIKSSTSFVNYFSGMWIGGLNNINNESCYLIKANNACTLEMTGNQAVPANHPITINPNWNWIGYPNTGETTVANAFSNFTPSNGDQVKSQNAFATYYGNMWIGGLNTITPGMGLLYKSNSTGAVTLVYPEPNRSEEVVKNVTNEDNHWTADYHAYPSNMTVMAVIELDEVELSGENYEIAAFADGECRGSAKLMYVAPIQRYIAFLTIVGDEASELRFSLYNDETGTEETQSIASLQYETNAIVGNLETPYVIRFRSTTGIDERYHNFAFFNGSEWVISDEGLCHGATLQIIDVLGRVIRCTDVARNVSTNGMMPGVYVLRLICGDEVRTQKIVVK